MGGGGVDERDGGAVARTGARVVVRRDFGRSPGAPGSGSAPR
ncbi:hypothetical protein APASM_0853 [Actinosynnema pretiosum subsp. pretiosum]|nr:hypothetical protein APASM_0853 [Actinosynnema pretiosum subsp. pretiosum]